MRKIIIFILFLIYARALPAKAQNMEWWNAYYYGYPRAGDMTLADQQENYGNLASASHLRVDVGDQGASASVFTTANRNSASAWSSHEVCILKLFLM